MGYQSAFAISAAGMNAELLRLEVAALNIANANTVAEPGKQGFIPRKVVLHASAAAHDASPIASFAARLDKSFDGPRASVEPTGHPARRVLDPGHPWADRDGMVRYPGVDTPAEMLTAMTAMRAYEANVAALNATRTLAAKALEIGA